MLNFAFPALFYIVTSTHCVVAELPKVGECTVYEIREGKQIRLCNHPRTNA